MIRKPALALLACSALYLGTARPAYALFGAGDIVFEPILESTEYQQMVNTFQQLSNDARTLQYWAQQATAMKSEVTQTLGVLDSLRHVTDLSQVTGLLNLSGIQNPLPTNTWGVQQMISGTGGLSGVGGLGSVVSANYSAQHVYTPTDSSFNSQLMQANAQGIAGTQALAQQLYQSMSSRLCAMNVLQARIASSPDAKTTADIQAQMLKLIGDIQAQQAQVAALSILAQEQARSNEQRNNENDAKQVDDLLADAAAHGFH